jgi:ABC-type glutathione transport system ATPase component
VVLFVIAAYMDKFRNTAYQRSSDRKINDQRKTHEPSQDVTALEKETFNLNPESDLQHKLISKSLLKVYPGGMAAVNNVSFNVKEGQVLGLLGPNGAGKSSTFSIVSMEKEKTNGEVTMMGDQVEEFKNMEKGQNMGMCA